MIQSVQRAFQLLEVIAAAPQGARLSDIADAAGLNRSTAHNLLATLQDLGYVEQPSRGGVYTLTDGLTELARGSSVTDDLLREQFHPALKRITEQTGETCYLAVPASGDYLCLDSVEARAPLRLTIPVGGREPLLGTAIGHALLACWARRVPTPRGRPARGVGGIRRRRGAGPQGRLRPGYGRLPRRHLLRRGPRPGRRQGARRHRRRRTHHATARGASAPDRRPRPEGRRRCSSRVRRASGPGRAPPGTARRASVPRPVRGVSPTPHGPTDPTSDRPAGRMDQVLLIAEAEHVEHAQPIGEPVFRLKSSRRTVARAAAVVLAGAASAATMTGSAEAIVNGTDSTQRYPSMVSIPVSGADDPRSRVSAGDR